MHVESPGKGNVTSSAEFNFHSDPEAADVVLRVLHCPITLITWELCIECASSWVSCIGIIIVRTSRLVRAVLWAYVLYGSVSTHLF